MSKKIEENKENTKDLIAEAAKLLFADRGYHGTSVRDIATEAGVNVAAINYHFGSKRDLLLSLAKEFSDSRAPIVYEILEHPTSKEDFITKLRLFISSFILAALEDANAHRMLLVNVEILFLEDSGFFRKNFEVLHKKMFGFMKEAQRKGILKKDYDAKLITHILFGSIVEMTRNGRLKREFLNISLDKKSDREKFASTLADCILSGFGEEKI